MNAFSRSNLAVALLRLTEAQEKARLLTVHEPGSSFVSGMSSTIDWSVREAIRLIENACAMEEMQSADTLPAAPDSNTRRIG